MGRWMVARMYGSSMRSMRIGGGSFAGLSITMAVAVRLHDAVGHGRRRRDECEGELALEPLLDDLHVQQAEEAAAEAEAQRVRGLGLVAEGRVVQAQLLDRVAERVVLRRLGRDRAR